MLLLFNLVGRIGGGVIDGLKVEKRGWGGGRKQRGKGEEKGGERRQNLSGSGYM